MKPWDAGEGGFVEFAAADIPRHSAKRFLRCSLLAACLVLPGVGANAADGFSGMAVTVVKTKAACFDDSIKLTGFILPREEVLVRPDVDGYHVARVLKVDGDEVKAGEKLIDLVKPDWLPQAMASTASIAANANGILVAPRPIPIGMPVAASADPVFRIIRNGEFDLVVDVPQTSLRKIKPGQSVRIEMLGAADIAGTVRSLETEVDFLSQLGRARVQITGKPSLRAGTFAIASIDTGRSCNTSVPLSAVLFGSQGSVVQVVRDGRIEVRPVQIGLFSGKNIEIKSGLKIDDLVVARAGAFLRESDPVRPLLVETQEASH
jgi:HlyD family secretion protein